MRKKIHIELFEEGENANIYSYRVNDGDLEFEKFIVSFIDSEQHIQNYDIVNDTIEKILLNGAQGNGGVKPKNVKRYQDIQHLNSIAEEMQIIGNKLKQSINDSSTIVYQKEFIQISNIFI